MDKPMLCPMSYNGRLIYYASDSEHEFGLHKPMECTPDCAWAIECGTINEPVYCCAVAYDSPAQESMINTRPLKGDAE